MFVSDRRRSSPDVPFDSDCLAVGMGTRLLSKTHSRPPQSPLPPPGGEAAGERLVEGGILRGGVGLWGTGDITSTTSRAYPTSPLKGQGPGGHTPLKDPTPPFGGAWSL